MARWFSLLCLLASGCAVHREAPTLPAFYHHGPPVQVPDVDVLGVSPQMQDFLDRFVMGYADRDLRLKLLTTSITDPAILGFHYQDDRTLTATEAFATRSGNCIGFANLVIAMARQAGLRAYYQQVALQPEWSSVEDTLLVARHVNVVLGGEAQTYVVDASGLTIRPGDRKHAMSDVEALALYYNNLGAEAILRRDLSGAWAYLAKAVTAAPGLEDPWINLGVVYGRNWQLEEAALMYRRALDIDGSETAALSNLYEVYMALGNEDAAAKLEPRVDRYRQRNPYYLLKLGEEALEESRFAEAMELLERAVEQKESEYLFHLALARALSLQGQHDAAAASLARARELAPGQRLEDPAWPWPEPAGEPAEDTPRSY